MAQFLVISKYGKKLNYNQDYKKNMFLSFQTSVCHSISSILLNYYKDNLWTVIGVWEIETVQVYEAWDYRKNPQKVNLFNENKLGKILKYLHIVSLNSNNDTNIARNTIIQSKNQLEQNVYGIKPILLKITIRTNTYGCTTWYFIHQRNFSLMQKHLLLMRFCN